ncbi:MAG: B3/B4 domain-containing protein [Thermocladium sp.]
MRIGISGDLSKLGIKLGVAVAMDVVNDTPIDLSQEWNNATQEAMKNTISTLLSDPIIRAYRDFYWRYLKIDPTKQRPSQEALIRRLLNGGRVPTINPAVDIGNIVSIKYKVPIGLYDIDKIRAEKLVLRYAAEGEVFIPIGSPRRKLSNNQIVLAASDGTILHVYPYRDSELTMVDQATRNILIISAGVPGISEETLLSAATETGVLYEKYLRGRLIKVDLIDGDKEIDVLPRRII